jgi:hypothetical protein
MSTCAGRPGELAPRRPRRRCADAAAQTAAELKLVLRNGEQVLLSLVLPLGSWRARAGPVRHVDGATTRGERADFFVPASWRWR